MSEDQYSKESMQRRLRDVRTRIERAVDHREHGEGEVELVAVGKTHPVEAMQQLYNAGVRSFGASYVQEWQRKAPRLPDDIRWHFIGRLQSNKAKYIADEVDLVHSVDRKSVSKRLNRRSEEPMDVLLQVNLGDQPTKGGVKSDKLEGLMDLVANYPKLRVRGLMGMPPYSEDPEDNRKYFRELRRALGRLQDYVEQKYPDRREGLEELSMGMTNDFEVAIDEGATIVRVGTALFGPRSYDD